MGSVKRSPELTKREHRIAYTKMSKADIIEAYCDIYRQMGGAGELDDTEWMQDLQERIALLKRYRDTEKRQAKQVVQP